MSKTFITWKHTRNDFKSTLSLEDKIKIFYHQILGWQLLIAIQLVNGDKSLKHADFSSLHIVLSYFETYSKYFKGDTSTYDSKKHFVRGVKSVYPRIFNTICNKKKILDDFYSLVRCGLYHMSLTKPKVFVYSGNAAIEYDSTKQVYFINTHLLTKDLITHFVKYKNDLLNHSNTKLRNNFEKVFDANH